MLFLVIIPIVILIILFVVCLNNPTARGKRGENNVKRVIGETVENEQYVINDIIIENEGKSSQIDHIVINPRGVFVIETKNYSGRIYGTETKREWTQVLADGNVKNKFYNPLKQNATHVYNVKKIVGKLPVYSLVVFVQNNTFHIQAPNVISLYELESVLQYGKNVLTIEQMRKAYDKLLASKADITMEEHVYNIREQQQKLEQGFCPRCNGRLVFKDGKYGAFWGCSNYPKCRFIKKDRDE